MPRSRCPSLSLHPVMASRREPHTAPQNTNNRDEVECTSRKRFKSRRECTARERIAQRGAPTAWKPELQPLIAWRQEPQFAWIYPLAPSVPAFLLSSSISPHSSGSPNPTRDHLDPTLVFPGAARANLERKAHLSQTPLSAFVPLCGPYPDPPGSLTS